MRITVSKTVIDSELTEGMQESSCVATCQNRDGLAIETVYNLGKIRQTTAMIWSYARFCQGKSQSQELAFALGC